MSVSLTAIAAALLPILLVLAGALDVVVRSIPNSVVILLAVCFGLFAGLTAMPFAQLAGHLLCGSTVLACGFALFSRSLIGGGDAKLMAGAALWFGFDSLLPFLAATALAGGVLAVACLFSNAARARFLPDKARQRTIPYGAAIAAGALVAFPEWFISIPVALQV